MNRSNTNSATSVSTSSDDFSTSSTSSISLGPFVKSSSDKINAHRLLDVDGVIRRRAAKSTVELTASTRSRLMAKSPYLQVQLNSSMKPVAKSPLQKRKSHRGGSLQRSAIKSQLTLSSVQLARASTPSTGTLCKISLRFLGCRPSSSVEGLVGRSHQVSLFQQHSGGNPLNVYRGHLQRGDTFTFTSRRQRGFPFSIVAYVDSILYLRVSGCCEYKYRQGCVLGGPKGHFALESVTGSFPCFNCHISKGLFLTRIPKQREGLNVVELPRTECVTSATPAEYEDDFEDNVQANYDHDCNKTSNDCGYATSSELIQTSQLARSDSDNYGDAEELNPVRDVDDDDDDDDDVPKDQVEFGIKDLSDVDDVGDVKREISEKLDQNNPDDVSALPRSEVIPESSGEDNQESVVDSSNDGQQRVTCSDTSNDDADSSVTSRSAESDVDDVRDVLDSDVSSNAPFMHQENAETTGIVAAAADATENNEEKDIDLAGSREQWTCYRDAAQNNYDSSDEDNELVYVAPKLTVTADVHAVQSPSRNQDVT